ncbi:type II toxin-antitoxin system PemK/MazF family toxin [Parapedobacter sp. 2B3]
MIFGWLTSIPQKVRNPVKRDPLCIELLRVHLQEGQLDRLSDILVDQIRAIDNNRLIKKLGRLTEDQIPKLKANTRIVLDIS